MQIPRPQKGEPPARALCGFRLLLGSALAPRALSVLQIIQQQTDVYQLQGDQIRPLRFFFPVMKLVPASQAGNLLPELFPNMVLLAKPDVICFLDSQEVCLH